MYNINSHNTSSYLFDIYSINNSIFNSNNTQRVNTDNTSQNIFINSLVVNNSSSQSTAIDNTVNGVHQIVSPYINKQPRTQVGRTINANQNANSSITNSLWQTITPANFIEKPESLNERLFYCYSCGDLETSQWRKGPYIAENDKSKAKYYKKSQPEATNTLCNACGGRYLKIKNDKGYAVAARDLKRNFFNYKQAKSVIKANQIVLNEKPFCYYCANLETVEWRKGPYKTEIQQLKAKQYNESEPETKRTLCNPCGTQYYLLKKEKGYKEAAHKFKKNYSSYEEAKNASKAERMDKIASRKKPPKKRRCTDSNNVLNQSFLASQVNQQSASHTSRTFTISSILNPENQESNNMILEYIRPTNSTF